MQAFSKKELQVIKKLDTPAKVQDYLNGLQFNFEKDKNGKTVETLKSPLLTLRTKEAHCFEGALLGAYILSLHGFTPYILHLASMPKDYDHVIVPFRTNNKLWGALSKTNHTVLRYREPVYRSIRELVMSYFHEYFLDNGVKTLRKYSKPLNLNTLGKSWVTDEKDLWHIDRKLDRIKHYSLFPKTVGKLRKADKIERKAGKIVEYHPSRNS